MASTGDMEASGSHPCDGFSFSLGACHALAQRPSVKLLNPLRQPVPDAFSSSDREEDPLDRCTDVYGFALVLNWLTFMGWESFLSMALKATCCTPVYFCTFPQKFNF